MKKNTSHFYVKTIFSYNVGRHNSTAKLKLLTISSITKVSFYCFTVSNEKIKPD